MLSYFLLAGSVNRWQQRDASLLLNGDPHRGGKTSVFEEQAAGNSVLDDVSDHEVSVTATIPPATATAMNEDSIPAISLVIIVGPVFSPEDEVCYYRIEAVVSGSPSPAVSFSKDDSYGAWGRRKAQINLKAEETYKLTAYAVNSEGGASVSIELGFIRDDHENDVIVPAEEPMVCLLQKLAAVLRLSSFLFMVTYGPLKQ